MTARSRHWWDVPHWAVWSLPSRLLASVLVVELLATLIVVFEVTITPLSAFTSNGVVAGSLIGCAVLHAEVSTRVERVRRRIGLQSAQIDLTSVWTFAAALLLPPLVATAMVVILMTFLYLRVWRGAKSPFYRSVFSNATVVLAVHAAAAVDLYFGGGVPSFGNGSSGLFPVVGALLAYTTINTCLVVGVVVISSDKSVRELLGHGDEVFLEIATLCLGALVALAMTSAGPWLVALVLPPMLVLHRAVLVRKLQEAVDTDGKTGLLTAAAWQKLAIQLVRRARTSDRSAAVLILDLDHFKRVNDTYGHLAGDAVLRAVANRLRTEVRDQDQVGRFGGEEFLILLPGATASYSHAELERVAERIRASVAGLSVEIPTADGPLTIDGLSVSIGGARFPEDGAEVPDLVGIADAALYEAKHSGRNAVRIGASTRRLPRVTDHADDVSVHDQSPQQPPSAN
ncbi:sensor domain-containing diguanylate cyclase [Pseudonocardia sp. GCM10023141]|uniref:sensor domain-containing diguanylate cyclase n=1 Tax=Pseudonocardia sp. GCM10023141 TaxID=3252653 RepID=UPI00360B4A2D